MDWRQWTDREVIGVTVEGLSAQMWRGVGRDVLSESEPKVDSIFAINSNHSFAYSSDCEPKQ